MDWIINDYCDIYIYIYFDSLEILDVQPSIHSDQSLQYFTGWIGHNAKRRQKAR